MTPQIRLSNPQRRALQAAAEGRLRWTRAAQNDGGYFIVDEPWQTSGVRPQTGEALVKRGLIARPRATVGDWSALVVEITDKGRAALDV